MALTTSACAIRYELSAQDVELYDCERYEMGMQCGIQRARGAE